MHKHDLRKSGFTIVELLVVIVVIGVLATISLVSYSGINRSAIVASMQTDLVNISKQLKLAQVNNSGFPESITDCPSPALGNLCVKTSGQNYVSSYSFDPNPQSFLVVIKNKGLTGQITENTLPEVPAVLSPIFLSGGIISQNGTTRTHTFNSGTTLTASAGGDVLISISGAGGGGGGSAETWGGSGTGATGASGGNSSINYIYSDTTYVAFGGSGGAGGRYITTASPYHFPGSIGADGGAQVQGSGSLLGWTSFTGGGGDGGASGGDCDGWCVSGGRGGKGGKFVGNLMDIKSGQQFVITVGSGGSGGAGYGSTPNGSVGTNGSVIISYQYEP